MIEMRELDFLIIGAAKSATTWLQQQLQAHDGVYMPDPELHFFSREYGRGMDWYLDQFAAPSKARTIGEKSNSYLDDPEAAARIHAHLPHIRLIAQLRNPVERAYSDYCMLFRRGEVDGDIERHLDPRYASGGRFLVGGDYAGQLVRYVDLYGSARLLILFFENVASDPEGQLSKTREHLGLPASTQKNVSSDRVKDKSAAQLPQNLRRRLTWLKPLVRPLRGNVAFEAVRSTMVQTPDYPPMSDDLRKRLADHFEPSVCALEDLVHSSLLHWR